MAVVVTYIKYVEASTKPLCDKYTGFSGQVYIKLNLFKLQGIHLAIISGRFFFIKGK